MMLKPAKVPVLLVALVAFGLAPALAQQPSTSPLPPQGEGAASGAQPSGEEPQSTAGPDDDAEELGLTGPEVQGNQPQGPNEQGMLQPDDAEGGEGDDGGQGDDLYTLLTRVWDAPAGLDGTPIERPNELGSQPAAEMEPLQPNDMYLFPDGYVE